MTVILQKCTLLTFILMIGLKKKKTSIYVDWLWKSLISTHIYVSYEAATPSSHCNYHGSEGGCYWSEIVLCAMSLWESPAISLFSRLRMRMCWTFEPYWLQLFEFVATFQHVVVSQTQNLFSQEPKGTVFSTAIKKSVKMWWFWPIIDTQQWKSNHQSSCTFGNFYRTAGTFFLGGS